MTANPTPQQAQGPWAIPREEAVPRLLEMHGGKLYGLARKICGNEQEAEDLVQEVFLQAWRKWHQFRGDANPLVWLYTIARHACQRMHRKRAGEPDRLASLDEPMPFGESRGAVLPDGLDTLESQVRREYQQLAGNAIAALPVDFRMPLILKEIIGFTIEEVAEILGIPKNTVKTRVHRARLKIRAAVEAGFQQTELPAPKYSTQVCMDLLQAKLDAMDRGVAMPNADSIICDRCQHVFSQLDFTRDLSRSLGEGDALPAPLRKVLVDAMQG